MSNTDIETMITTLGKQAKAAAKVLACATTEQKNQALTIAANALRENMDALLNANALDVLSVKKAGKADSFVDRLELNPERVEGMAVALEDIAKLADPVGRVLAEFDRPNGLKITRVATPIGVIGMIYESRPNVGADAGALCLKSGNTVILRGGSESLNSTRIIVECMATGLRAAGLPANCIQLVDTDDRSAVAALLRCADYVDLVIPRGGRGLVELVRNEAQVPTLLHLDGNNHIYVDKDADVAKALSIIKNAKLRRTGVCGATESLVLDQAIAKEFLPQLVETLVGCEIRGDVAAQACDPRINVATDADWDTEYLDAILSVKIVSSLDEALDFIEEHSSKHTDAIITENAEVAETFMRSVDSAVVMHNASTQFADGGEFGMGAEIGIATGKVHARGPVGLEQLTIFKYRVAGQGQTRP
ncbi:glutamate-5-semialdehyde dehydrogenase [Colwellia hornerae]|uniref:Gamma-glutamyl phosphate reductase n=1 Tax=Colwellia hornerae TaxID=89402 RepID=A0A5C6QDB4_9GAMM|nr:glutamate-5-semialdehyde dehydrogenase [Colwellia hornerae]TWX59381.1 glutamate-5-semialdehyde dehydrogenase [Colwellia hornerae]TWX62751.1 glutamate-5-semialdehyde dehydrogenase [Colwellia hornerae]TWX67065.1 glutamate-5-semialdehyde dehydrogenase [Colwellia hornerae]